MTDKNKKPFLDYINKDKKKKPRKKRLSIKPTRRTPSGTKLKAGVKVSVKF